MIPVNGLIALFAQMYREHWAYKWGSAKRGEVDCSGAFVWAYKQFGASIYHGSNSIARLYVSGLFRPSGTFPKGEEWDRVKPGYAAFKWRAKDTAKYPDGRGDFYHIGLVAEDGKTVYEARGTKEGFTTSAVSAWQWFAPLKDVQYDEGGQTMEPYNAVVSTASGSLNMRSGPGLSYPITFKLPKGTPVTVLIAYDTGWAFVDEDGTQGYVALKYLTRTEAPESAQGTESYPTALDGRSPLSSELAREGLDGTAVKWGVFAPCDSREEAEALQKAHKGAILTCYNPASYKPPDEKGGD